MAPRKTTQLVASSSLFGDCVFLAPFLKGSSTELSVDHGSHQLDLCEFG